MKKVTKIFFTIISIFITMFFSVFLIASCGSNGEADNYIDVDDNFNVNISFNQKITEYTYNYNFLYDIKITIKAKSSASKDDLFLKISIFDRDVSTSGEEIITRYYKVNSNTNINKTIYDVYSNYLLVPAFTEVRVVKSKGKDYTKKFFDDKTISFNTNGGSKLNSITVNNKSTVSLPVPYKKGYVFEGWYTDNNFQKMPTVYTDLVDGMTLYAKWKLENYTITYFIDEVESDSTNYNITSPEITLSEPSVDGYNFEGWYDNKSFDGEPISSITKGSAGNIKLYAKLEPKKYDVELVFNDGETENIVVKETYGEKYTDLPIPTRNGFIFEGWYLDENDYDSYADIVSIPDNHTIYAKWIEGTSGLTYTKTSKGWEITGCTNTDATTLKIPESIMGINVVSIKENAFNNMVSVTEISIPNTVTSIGQRAFKGMNKLTEVVIPDSVTSIGEKIFYDCNLIQSIVLPYIPNYYLNSDTYNYLGYVFGASDKSTYYSQDNSQYVPKSLTKVTITKMTKLADNAFYNLSSLTEITLPNTITSIGNRVFYNCIGLTEIYIPENVNSIGAYAFYNCENLTQITIPSGVTKINNYSFYNLNKITEITIPAGVTEIGEYAFAGCSGINNITIPSNCTKIGSYAFKGMNKLTEVVIPDSVTSIGEKIFYDCNLIQSIVLPYIPNYYLNSDTYNYLGYVFGASDKSTYYSQDNSQYVPKSLTKVTITKMTKLADNAFYNLSSLTEITLPNTITSIGNRVFYNCIGLTKVYFNGTLDEWNQLISNSNGNTPLDYGAKLYVFENGEYVEVNNE